MRFVIRRVTIRFVRCTLPAPVLATGTRTETDVVLEPAAILAAVLAVTVAPTVVLVTTAVLVVVMRTTSTVRQQVHRNLK